MKKITIREAQPSDCRLILEFILDLAEYEKLRHEVVATEAQLNKTLFKDKPSAFVIIAEQESEAIGFALYFFNYSTFLAKPGLYLEDLYVKPQYRGSGAGKLLLSHLAKIALDTDCGRLEWWVLDWNQPAINFYQSIGAQAMDEWTVHRLTGDALRSLAEHIDD